MSDRNNTDEALEDAMTDALIRAELHALEDSVFRERLEQIWAETYGAFNEGADLVILMQWIAYQWERARDGSGG